MDILRKHMNCQVIEKRISCAELYCGLAFHDIMADGP